MQKTPDIESLGPYVRHVADHMQLRDWNFGVEFDGHLACALAAIECVPNRQYATISISPDFLEASDTEQRYAIVHELVHCHLNPVQTMFGTLAGVHGQTHQTLQQNHDNHIESATDRLARAIAAGMPTPKGFYDGYRKAQGGKAGRNRHGEVKAAGEP